MGVPLLGCFSIMKFRITKKKIKKKNFYELMQNKNWLGASCLPRRIWLDSKVIYQEWMRRFLAVLVFSDLRLLKIHN